MGKKTNAMKTSIKLAIPRYMVIISVIYITVIAIISQEFIANSVGSDLDVKISFLTIFIFYNTTYLEKILNNAEVFYLLSDRLKQREFIRRFTVKYVYTIILFVISYFFYFCKDRTFIYMDKGFAILFIEAFFSALCSIFLWGNVTCFVVYKVNNTWVGMGVTGAVWYLLNTTLNKVLQQKIPIYLNIYSNLVNDKNGDLISGWEYGKVFALTVGIIIFIINIFSVYYSKSARRIT